jgi:hypothetical protein
MLPVPSEMHNMLPSLSCRKKGQKVALPFAVLHLKPFPIGEVLTSFFFLFYFFYFILLLFSGTLML